MASLDQPHIVQRQVMRDERDQLERGLDDYTPEQERQAIVHSRQDMMLLVGLLSSIDKHLYRISISLIVLLGVIAYRFVK